jgi:hypothetical protein
MIWRLMASILVMSDTGSVSLVTQSTDWPDEVSCRETLQSHYSVPPPQSVDGHRVTIKISASCVPVSGEQQIGLPPPIANILPRIFPGAPPMLAPPCGGRLPCDY